MITSPGGSGVLVIGGFNYNADDYSIAIMELKEILLNHWNGQL